MPGHTSKKQSQRTKGNLRPSSSSHAAQLLSSTGSTGFVGFGQGPQYVPASQILDDVDSSLDADFRMVLRQLTKRDATTKIKGLQVFSNLCQEQKDESLMAVLPFWPRTYSKMVLDVDYRVRETAQHAMSTLVVRMRRNLAPYLKGLMGPWMLSQCDTYPTVASAAQQSFQAAFPPSKQADALVFCKEGIIEYLTDNLLKQTAQSLSDPKTTDPEDMKNKYNRVVTSSLLAVRRLLTTLPADHAQSLSQQIGSMLEDPKFWKLAKSQVNMIKGAFYSCLAGICQRFPELSSRSPTVDKMAPLILHHLADSDPAICCHVWEAALSLVNHVEDCWNHINVMKGFWPELKSILENGCHGNAVVIGPSLVPLVSRIPGDMFPNMNKFYEDFFTCFRTGLSSSTVQSSVSECAALVRAYMECAHYVVLSAEAPGASYILIDQVLPVIEASFVEDKSLLYRTPLYSVLGTMLTNLEQSDSPATRNAAADFWAQLVACLQQHMELFYSGNCEVSDFSNRVISFVRSLVYPEMEVKQKPARVRFEPDAEDVESTLKEMKVTEKSELGRGARMFIQNLTLQAVQKVHSNFSTEHLRIFSQLIELDSSEETVSKVIQCCHAGGDASFQSASTYFVFEICVPWLSKLGEAPDSDPSYLIQIVCVFISQLEVESVNLLLDKLCQTLTDLGPLYILIQKLFKMIKSNPAVKEWISSDRFGEKLHVVAEDVCLNSLDPAQDKQDCEAGWRILTLVLSAYEDDEPIVKADYIQKILVSIQRSLVQLQSCPATDRVDTAVSFVAKATHSFFSGFQACLSMTSATDLLLILFEITLYNKYNIKDATLLEARNAWSLGIQNSIRQTGGYLGDTGALCRAAQVVRDTVLTHDTSNHILTSILSSVESLLQTVKDSLPATPDINPVYVTFCDQLMVPCHAHINSQMWEYLCVSGRCSSVPQSTDISTFPTQTLFTSLYNSLLLKISSAAETSADTCSTMDVPSATDDGDITVETCVEKQMAVVDWSAERLSCLLDCVIGLAVIRLSQDVNKVVKTFLSVMEATEELSQTVTTLIQRLDKTERVQLWETAFSRSADEPGVSLCLGSLLAMISQVSDDKHTVQLSPVLDRCSTLNESTLCMLHSVIKYMTASDVLTLTEIMVARILSLPQESVTSLDGGRGLLPVVMWCVGGAMESHPEETGALVTATLDQVLAWKEAEEDLLLYSCDINDTGSDVVLFNAELSRFLTCAVASPSDTLTAKHWDFVMCSLVSWIQTLAESQAGLLTSAAIQSLAVGVSDLLTQVAQGVQGAGFPPNLVTEWQEFFSDSAYSVLLPLYLKLHDGFRRKSPSGTGGLVLSAVCEAVSHITKEKVLDHGLPPLLVAGDLSPLPDGLQTLLNHISPMLLSSDRAVQIAAFCVLDRVMPELPGYETEDKSVPEGATGGQEEVTQRSPPMGLLRVLEEGSAVLDGLLLDVDIEGCVVVGTRDPAYRPALAYLLAWRLIMAFFRSAPAQLRQEYAAYLQSQGSVHRLMFHLFRLMPTNPGKMFSDTPDTPVKAEGSRTEIQHVSCCLYRTALKTMPAMVRQWWKDQDRKTAAYVDKFTTKHVSHLLCTSEIQAVQNTDVQLDYISIKARSATREVVATYVLEEVTIEIVTTLPPNYPLGNISVVSEKRVGVSGPQWEKWLLQLNIFLQHQNGNIMDGLKIWKSNIDKRFEGVDDCMICYSVLHGTTFQLPRMTCRTCKKKYHSACLYKWFNTSHNCTCPLCRNLF